MYCSFMRPGYTLADNYFQSGIIYFTRINLAFGLTTKLQPRFKYIIPVQMWVE
jgi:hypothetical protein